MKYERNPVQLTGFDTDQTRIACRTRTCLGSDMTLHARFLIALIGTAFGCLPQAQGADLSHFQYWRMYTRQDGETTVERLSWSATPVQDLGSSRDIVHFFVEHASSMTVVSGKPGGHASMHSIGTDNELVLVLRGSSVGRFAAGRTQNFHAGDVVLVEDHSSKGLPVAFGPAGYMALAVTLHPDKP